MPAVKPMYIRFLPGTLPPLYQELHDGCISTVGATSAVVSSTHSRWAARQCLHTVWRHIASLDGSGVQRYRAASRRRWTRIDGSAGPTVPSFVTLDHVATQRAQALDLDVELRQPVCHRGVVERA